MFRDSASKGEHATLPSPFASDEKSGHAHPFPAPIPQSQPSFRSNETYLRSHDDDDDEGDHLLRRNGGGTGGEFSRLRTARIIYLLLRYKIGTTRSKRKMRNNNVTTSLTNMLLTSSLTYSFLLPSSLPLSKYSLSFFLSDSFCPSRRH